MGLNIRSIVPAAQEPVATVFQYAKEGYSILERNKKELILTAAVIGLAFSGLGKPPMDNANGQIVLTAQGDQQINIDANGTADQNPFAKYIASHPELKNVTAIATSGYTEKEANKVTFATQSEVKIPKLNAPSLEENIQDRLGERFEVVKQIDDQIGGKYCGFPEYPWGHIVGNILNDIPNALCDGSKPVGTWLRINTAGTAYGPFGPEQEAYYAPGHTLRVGETLSNETDEVYFSLDTIPATVLWHDKGNGCYQRTNNPIINYKEADSVYFVFESNYDKLSERVDNSFRMIHIVDGGESFETLSAYIAQNYYPGAYPPGSYLFIRTVGGMGDPGYVSFSDQPTFTYYSKIEDGVGRTYTITPVHTGEAVGEGRVVRYEEAPPSFFKIHGIDEQFFSMYVPLKECQAAWQWSAPTRIENCHI